MGFGNHLTATFQLEAAWKSQSGLSTVVRRMLQSSRNRESVTLQFIQFGRDPTGTERPRYLDDDLPKPDGHAQLAMSSPTDPRTRVLVMLRL